MGTADQRWWGGRLLDRLIASDQPEEIRAQLLQTVLQRRPALILSSSAIMLMSLSSAIVLRAPWTLAWCALDIVLVGYRIYLSFRYEPPGAPAPEWEVRRVLGISLVIFLLLGLGAMLSFRTGVSSLRLIGAVSVMGLVAGLVSRWAAFPRLAVAAMASVGLLSAAGLVMAPDASARWGALQLLLIVTGTGALAVQNHRTLIGMLHARAEAARLARTDPLTGLPNRARLIEALTASCAGTAPFALLYLDLDGFKAVNDGDGHAAGDAMLRAVGAALAALGERGGAVACRVGGDEFVLLAGGDAGQAARVAEQAIVAVAAAGKGRIGASVGIALAPEDGQDVDRLMRRADRALYAAKRGGRGRLCFWQGLTVEQAA